jgi:hypothetical protein
MPEQISPQNRPDYRSTAVKAMAAGQTTVRDVKAGTLALRAQGKTYLPQFPAEDDASYTDRLATATLFNAYGRTVAGLVGMVFKKNPVFADDVPEVIRGRGEVRDKETGAVKTQKAEGHIESIDLAGTHFDVFAREVLEDAFDGHAFVLVDMQAALGSGATLADEIKAGRRPYWVRYKAGQAVNFRSVVINGRTEIGQVTFEESVCVPDGEYGEKAVLRYRTFTLAQDGAGALRVLWSLKEKRVDPITQEVTFDLIGDGDIPGFARIPVAVVYGKKTGFLTSQPPLIDLALLNLKFYQKESDRDHSEHMCGNPIPVFKVGDPESWKVVKAGSGFGIVLNKDEDFMYGEPQGNALEQTAKTLDALRGQMATLGLSVLEGTPQVKGTATEAVLDFTQESSELETIARSAQDAFELCLGFHAKYLGLPSGGSVEIGGELKSARLTRSDIQTYSNMVAANQLTLATLWKIMERAGALPDGFNATEEQAGLKAQTDAAALDMQKLFNKGGALSVPPVGQPPTGAGA